jgi:hypothetical protein
MTIFYKRVLLCLTYLVGLHLMEIRSIIVRQNELLITCSTIFITQDNVSKEQRKFSRFCKVPIYCTMNSCFQSKATNLRFHVLTVASMKMKAFWGIAPYSLVEVDRRFRGAYCTHNQGNEP